AGKITHLAQRSARLLSPVPLATLSNLKFTCPGCDAPAYAKVMNDSLEIRFTSLPDEMRSLLEKHRGKNSQADGEKIP
ncbi:MAG: hypothetical protein K2P57_04345, partial [Burkholderiales bacterium]|nr:hypothetical protein [Burkholderiales bacterium]